MPIQTLRDLRWSLEASSNVCTWGLDPSHHLRRYPSGLKGPSPGGAGTKVRRAEGTLQGGLEGPCGRQGVGSLNKEFDFRSWHCGRQRGGNLNKEFEFRSWHCGRQGGEV